MVGHRVAYFTPQHKLSMNCVILHIVNKTHIYIIMLILQSIVEFHGKKQESVVVGQIYKF